MECPPTIMGITKIVITMIHVTILKGVATLVRGLQDAIIIMIGMRITCQDKNNLAMRTMIFVNKCLLLNKSIVKRYRNQMHLVLKVNLYTKSNLTNNSMKRKHPKTISKLFRFLLHPTTTIIMCVIPMTIGTTIATITMQEELPTMIPMVIQVIVMVMMKCHKMEGEITMFNHIIGTANQ
jgi:hypothetical protein